MKIVVVIPARYHSTRLPGKPLALIQGQSMLQRVVRFTQAALLGLDTASIIVATDDERIMAHCDTLQVEAMMTSADLPSGTDRVAETVSRLSEPADFILNMQGDAPLTPPDFLRAMIDTFIASSCDVVTPVTQLTWEQLDTLRQNKLTTPFSGTTAVFNQSNGHAYWFSKNILPALRNEKVLREQTEKSPVYRHIGLYGYAKEALQQYINLPESTYEQYEGLEQLRLLENGFTIRCVPVEYKNRASMSGIDSPEDILRAEKLIAQYGELLP